MLVSIGNQPRSLYVPPPTKKGEMTIPSLLAMLPVGDEAIISIGIEVFILMIYDD